MDVLLVSRVAVSFQSVDTPLAYNVHTILKHTIVDSESLPSRIGQFPIS